MSILWDVNLPCRVRGKVKRTSGPIQQAEGSCVFLHIEEIEGKLKGTEVAVTVRVDNSLSARMAQPGDIVYVEWRPDNCFRLEGNLEGEILCAVATRFHLSRRVDSAFGSRFVTPDWFDGR